MPHPDDPHRIALRSALRAARALRHCTARDLSDKIGFSPHTINMWESGQRTPSGVSVVKLAHACDLTMTDFGHLIDLGDPDGWAPSRIVFRAHAGTRGAREISTEGTTA